MKNKVKTWKTTKFTRFFYRKCDRKPNLPQKVWKTFLSRGILPWVDRFTWNTNIFFLGLRGCNCQEADKTMAFEFKYELRYNFWIWLPLQLPVQLPVLTSGSNFRYYFRLLFWFYFRLHFRYYFRLHFRVQFQSEKGIAVHFLCETSCPPRTVHYT